MKGFKTYKTIQLILCIVVAAAGIIFVVTNKDLFHIIANDPGVRALCITLWVLLVISFFFIFLDFKTFAKTVQSIHELDHSVHSDPSTGLANRYSCDMIIEKYLDKELPRGIGCIMFDIINIQQVNRAFGHIAGNVAIIDFSNILLNAAVDRCFVGRNGGNKFMAIFENYNKENISLFLTIIETNVAEHNKVAGAYPIEYKYGISLAEESSAQTITELIAEANRKIYNHDAE